MVHPRISGSPTGTVTNNNGPVTLGSAPVGTPFSTGVLPVGSLSITAVYSGDANFSGSSSAAITHPPGTGSATVITYDARARAHGYSFQRSSKVCAQFTLTVISEFRIPGAATSDNNG